MGKFKVNISMSPTATSPVPTRARRIHSGSGESSFTSGWFRSGRREPRKEGGEGQREHADRRGDLRRGHHGSKHVRRRAWTVGRRPLEGLVGRQPALPHLGLRSHPPPARAAGDAGRNHVLLRHGWNRVGARAGLGSRRRQGRLSAAVRARRSSTWRRVCWTRSSSRSSCDARKRRTAVRQPGRRQAQARASRGDRGAGVAHQIRARRRPALGIGGVRSRSSGCWSSCHDASPNPSRRHRTASGGAASPPSPRIRGGSSRLTHEPRGDCYPGITCVAGSRVFRNLGKGPTQHQPSTAPHAARPRPSRTARPCASCMAAEDGMAPGSGATGRHAKNGPRHAQAKFEHVA